MPITRAQVIKAERLQDAAIEDTSALVHVIAGPGSGKSKVVVGRALRALGDGIEPKLLRAISFTRHSAGDLSARLKRSLKERGIDARITASTLHSLALSLLRQGKLLEDLSPLTVLDDWETETIFDVEFGSYSGIPKATSYARNGRGMGNRWEEIRRYFEAFWSSDDPDYAASVTLSSPVTKDEHEKFTAFKNWTRSMYSAFLPGESVYECVKACEQGALAPAEVLPLDLLLVDEAQDLNRIDFRLIEAYRRASTDVLVVGDDDQSIYSFRFASPAEFRNLRQSPGAGQHFLAFCFRCAPNVLQPAQTLLREHSPSRQRDAEATSLYADSDPVVDGMTSYHRFDDSVTEARAIAEAIKELESAGVPLSEISIVLRSVKPNGPWDVISEALEALNIPAKVNAGDDFKDELGSRFVFSLLRIVCEGEVQIALRTLWEVTHGVGVEARKQLLEFMREFGLDYFSAASGKRLALCTNPKFSRAKSAQDKILRGLELVSPFEKDQAFGELRPVFTDLSERLLDRKSAVSAKALVDLVPDEATAAEVLQSLYAARTREAFVLGLTAAQTEDSGTKVEASEVEEVQVYTYHGVKGLESDVVFLPALEEGILPHSKISNVPPLIEEAARLLYVGMSRARLACFISYSDVRQVNGRYVSQARSRFCRSFSGWQSGAILDASIAANVAEWRPQLGVESPEPQ